MAAGIWSDFLDLVREQPLVLEGLLAVVIFVFLLLVFRRFRKVAEELERRKSLGDYVRGLDEFLRGDFREAIGTLERVLERDPENVEARIALGDCYREMGDAAEAKRHHHHVHKVFGHELARNFVSLGRDELALQHYEEAVAAFERAQELNPADRDAMAGLAQAYAEGGNPLEAARHLRALYPEGPTEAMGVRERREAASRFSDAGAALLEEGDAEGAVRLYTEALAFAPQSMRSRTGLLRAAHALGDEQRARELVERHLADLRSLTDAGEMLFEPTAASAASAAAPAAAEAEEPAIEGTGRFLPARLEEVGALVAAVEARTARYSCSACGALLRDYAPRCGTCQLVGTIEPLAPLTELYTIPVADFREALDAVEENSAFVQALARKASLGDAQALDRLLEKGRAVLYEVFAALPALEARRALGAKLAALGADAAREVQHCHAARAGNGRGAAARPHDDFAAAFYLALGDARGDALLDTLGAARNAALAGVMADPRVDDAIRDRARDRLRARGADSLVPIVEALAASGDFGGMERAAGLVREWGPPAVESLEKTYLQATLLGRIFRGKSGARRRTCADILARSGLRQAAEALSRAAAREKDTDLRAHYVAARERAGQAGGEP